MGGGLHAGLMQGGKHSREANALAQITRQVWGRSRTTGQNSRLGPPLPSGCLRQISFLPGNGPGVSGKVTEVRPLPAPRLRPHACSLLIWVATWWHCGVATDWQPPWEPQSSQLREGRTRTERVLCADLILDEKTGAQRGAGTPCRSYAASVRRRKTK